MSKHTPGPWVVNIPTKRSLPHIMTRDGVYVMDAPPRDGLRHAGVRQMADARLIAAAPDLLSNLKFAVSILSGIPAIGSTARRNRQSGWI